METSGVREYEISIEVSSNRLRALGLTLEDIANAVRRGSMELSAGKISTGEEEVRVRTIGQNYDQDDFEEIIVLSRPDGTSLRLGDIAEVRDGFADTELITRFNGNRAVRVDVSRTADEQVLEIAEAVRAYLAAEIVPFLPEGVEVEIWRDDTTLVGSRLSLLIENGLVGLVLVFLSLTLFLEVRLAVWVGAGLVVSLVATLWVMMILGISINIFSMLTTITAFCALLAVPGPSGKLMRSIPIVVIAILAISLVESLLILPRHLSHLQGTPAGTQAPGPYPGPDSGRPGTPGAIRLLRQRSPAGGLWRSRRHPSSHAGRSRPGHVTSQLRNAAAGPFFSHGALVALGSSGLTGEPVPDPWLPSVLSWVSSTAYKRAGTMAEKLSPEEVENWTAVHSRWKFRDDAIRKTYTFPSFRSAIVFVNRVATIADEVDHHPDITIRYDKISLKLWSHDAGGVTERDLKLAERIDFATSAR